MKEKRYFQRIIGAVIWLMLPLLGPGPALASPEAWLSTVEVQEKEIRKDIRRMWVRAQRENARTRTKLKRELQKTENELSRLEKKIRSKEIQKFDEWASDNWKKVLQQAKSLHDYNEKGVEDLRQRLKKKND